MARRKTATQIVRYSQPRVAAPIIRVSAPRAAPKHKRRGRGRGGHSAQKIIMGMALGGLVLGFIDKQALAIPTIPILGKAGTIALGAYFIFKNQPNGIGMDVAKAAAAVAAYQFGLAGKVAGDELSGIASQV